MISLSLEEVEEQRAGRCGACKLYDEKQDTCVIYPGGIPSLILNTEPKKNEKCAQWVERLTRKELKERFLSMSETKKGAEFRILFNARNGEPPDPRDLELLNNKQGRPLKDQGLFGAFHENYEILDNYTELREYGVNYDIACELAAYIHNNRELPPLMKKTIGSKTVKAIITDSIDGAKKEFLKNRPLCLNNTNETPEEEWKRFLGEQKAYFRGRKKK